MSPGPGSGETLLRPVVAYPPVSSRVSYVHAAMKRAPRRCHFSTSRVCSNMRVRNTHRMVAVVEAGHGSVTPAPPVYVYETPATIVGIQTNASYKK